jgi:predicted DNA-binding transcriptional regulator
MAKLVVKKTVSKDQAIGGLIFIVCLVIIIGYLIALFGADWVVNTLNIGSVSGIRYWLAEIPVLIAVVAVLGIGAWIGWTMATTPPPKPIEEIEAEEKKEEEKPEGEEKAAEKKK